MNPELISNAFVRAADKVLRRVQCKWEACHRFTVPATGIISGFYAIIKQSELCNTTLIITHKNNKHRLDLSKDFHPVKIACREDEQIEITANTTSPTTEIFLTIEHETLATGNKHAIETSHHELLINFQQHAEHF